MKLTLEDLGYSVEIETHRKDHNLDSFGVGRVISEHRERYMVRTVEAEYEGEIIGNFRFSARNKSDFPDVGDWVAISEYDDNSEFVDIYPTLCEMAGFQVPDYLQGSSMVPLLENPDTEWKTAAYSQFLLGRFGRTKTVDGEQMGYAIRTDRYRYVEWYWWNKDKKARGDFITRELFDYNSDLQENFNRASDPEYKKTVELLSEQLGKG